MQFDIEYAQLKRKTWHFTKSDILDALCQAHKIDLTRKTTNDFDFDLPLPTMDDHGTVALLEVRYEE